MLLHFCKYFFFYIIHSKTRQRLLFLASSGLIISAFALLVLQSTMGGLQNNLINRSKDTIGRGVIRLQNISLEDSYKIKKSLDNLGIQSFVEYELELLLKKDKFLTPVILHGLDLKILKKNEDGSKVRPFFLSDSRMGELAVPFDLANRFSAMPGDKVTLISPTHSDPLLIEVPRQMTFVIDDLIETEVPEIDAFHIWARLAVVQNFIRKKEVNRIRIYSPFDTEKINQLLAPYGVNVLTWEAQNQGLVWALGLETTVMVFLFVCMSFLVSLCILSGLLIFFNKVKIDLASFWILGANEKDLLKSSRIFLVMISFIAVTLGILLGIIFLLLLDHYAPNIMPSIFVDRKIPIFITLKGVLVSFFVPFSISIFFSFIGLSAIRKQGQTYLELIRSYG